MDLGKVGAGGEGGEDGRWVWRGFRGLIYRKGLWSQPAQGQGSAAEGRRGVEMLAAVGYRGWGGGQNKWRRRWW